ncbi:hypothetical protein AcV5_000132 [Taiwanofungus camphoratus]|nr:hypothetical protein AcV5_000132 [Antrodia cinnamomea]
MSITLGCAVIAGQRRRGAENVCVFAAGSIDHCSEPRPSLEPEARGKRREWKRCCAICTCKEEKASCAAPPGLRRAHSPARPDESGNAARRGSIQAQSTSAGTVTTGHRGSTRRIRRASCPLSAPGHQQTGDGREEILRNAMCMRMRNGLRKGEWENASAYVRAGRAQMGFPLAITGAATVVLQGVWASQPLIGLRVQIGWWTDGRAP